MVCLFSFPGFGDQERPERPGPSLLQGVHDFASSEIDWMGLIQVPSRQPSHSRTGGRPQARATWGRSDVGAKVVIHKRKIGLPVAFSATPVKEGVRPWSCGNNGKPEVSLGEPGAGW